MARAHAEASAAWRSPVGKELPALALGRATSCAATHTGEGGNYITGSIFIWHKCMLVHVTHIPSFSFRSHTHTHTFHWFPYIQCQMMHRERRLCKVTCFV